MVAHRLQIPVSVIFALCKPSAGVMPVLLWTMIAAVYVIDQMFACNVSIYYKQSLRHIYTLTELLDMDRFATLLDLSK